MSPQCFVCNLPILSHQVGLRWQGGSGVDDLLREQINMVSQKYQSYIVSNLRNIINFVEISIIFSRQKAKVHLLS